MGHALQHTLMDVMTRHKRMRGYRTLWLPGMDHAGISTQLMVSRALKREGKSRHDLGREKFVERVWQWKHESGGQITVQMRREGVSVDWSREKFTMDEDLSRAVREVFVQLYEEGMIYRGDRIVNWCPNDQTVLSDLEVEKLPQAGKLYYLQYPIKNSDARVTVATTRPETMLGDTAVAVNPNDERYKDLVGQTILLPLTGREVPIIADEYVDPEFGTGAVKVTPAHDPNDYEMGLRHNLPQIVVIDPFAKMTTDAGPDFAGLDRYKAREKVIANFETLELLEKVIAARLWTSVRTGSQSSGWAPTCSSGSTAMAHAALLAGVCFKPSRTVSAARRGLPVSVWNTASAMAASTTAWCPRSSARQASRCSRDDEAPGCQAIAVRAAIAAV
jgi:valyl-tRNA synthetase